MLKQHAAQHWWRREQVEIEAAALFSELSHTLGGSLAEAAREASDDELRHADQCRALVERLDPGQHAPVARTRRASSIAPAGLRDPARRALYTAVAVGCVTESLSVALLMEIRQTATDSLVQDTAQAILKDEVRHSRLGWGALAAARASGDLSWLRPHIPAMISAALDEEGASPVGESALPPGVLEDFGVLSPDVVARVCAVTLAQVIEPGLAHFGV